ncbi:hypothetical protein [Nocardioides currus]|uniref:Oligosaccharide repeat unit polymerase n=1 Tax=Nocardioides currus TaxID=2133958 RepID=A0A2R7Z312_9ACTN|nr:hypothetical protein [Nocardioides currus]PUA83021.1 hypothetical protein C7S10_04905 [Nocardioides currus]
MILADVLMVGTVAFLLAYVLLCSAVFRVTRSPAMVIVLALGAYWSLVGALSILPSKRVAGGTTFTYMEDRLYPILVDGDYALTLLSYAGFLTIAALTVLLLAKPAGRDPEALGTWQRLSGRFAHPVLVAILSVFTALKVLIVGILVAGSGGASLYTATRTVQGSLGGELRIYQYLNVTTSYSLAAGLALWLGFVAGRQRYRPTARRFLWLAYAALFLEVMAENALLGNRAVPLVIMGAVGTGWLRWRYLPSTRVERRPQAARFLLLALLGLLALGAIGNSRGGDLSSPGAVVQALETSVTQPRAIVEQVAGSSEKIASHMSLYGVIRSQDLVRDPFAANSYQAYATLVDAPADQVFTVHYVAAWWMRLGPLGVPVAGLSFGLVLAVLQRLALAARGLVRSAFALPAAVLPAAGLPVIVLRSGPESLRAVVVELVLLPGLVCLAACWAGSRSPAPPDTDPLDATLEPPHTGHQEHYV